MGLKNTSQWRRLKARLNEQKIKEDSKWDGLHGVVTNIDNQSAHQLLTRYRQLWKIEEAFRVCKHSLKMRPVYHWKKKRIKAHIAICFLAYSLSYTMKHRMEQRGLKFSLQKMREVLKRDQYSLIEDQKTKKLYRMPSKYSEPIKQIYEAFNLKRVSQITPVS
ncbi:MAG: transposase [Bdellovibrionales bacterium]|nr:transposase [Bdellovibrionales bacterium]